MPGNILETIDRLKRELDALRPLPCAPRGPAAISPGIASCTSRSPGNCVLPKLT